MGRERHGAPPGRRRHLVKAALFVLLLALTVLLVDLLSRFSPLDDVRNVKYFPDGLLVDDPEMGVRMAAGFEKSWFEFGGPGHWVFTNGLGCFDYPVATDLEDYIVFLGDSWTWGYTPLEKKFTSLIERELNVRALKCGVTGTGSKYQLAFLERISARMKHKPRMVVQLYTGNDFNDDFRYPGYRVIEGQRAPRHASVNLETCERKHFGEDALIRRTRRARENIRDRGFLEKYSIIYNLIKYNERQFRQQDIREAFAQSDVPSTQVMTYRYIPNLLDMKTSEEGCIRESFTEHLAAIEKTQELVERLGGRYVLFLLLAPDGSLSPGGCGPESYCRELRALVAEKIRHHDVIRREGHSHPFDGHWDEKGNAVAAELMLESLRGKGLVE